KTQLLLHKCSQQSLQSTVSNSTATCNLEKISLAQNLYLRVIDAIVPGKKQCTSHMAEYLARHHQGKPKGCR
ncbi:hypothetical protein LEMLEM_LOCUS8671, partial [Lemmus lemmus]